MKRLKQVPMIVPYRNGKVMVGDKEFAIKDGSQGRTMLIELLVEDGKLSEKISNNKALKIIRDTVLSQTMITNDPITKKRLIPNSSNFFGGSVYSFDKTEEGFYLIVLRNMEGGNDGKCFPSDKIGGIMIPDLDLVTGAGKKLLEDAGFLTDEPMIDEKQIVTEEEPDITVDPKTLAEAINKTTELVNNKLQNRERRVSKPI